MVRSDGPLYPKKIKLTYEDGTELDIDNEHFIAVWMEGLYKREEDPPKTITRTTDDCWIHENITVRLKG